MESSFCIFCLLDKPEPILYNGLCDCHPPLHTECLNNWHKTQPNSCPICLKQYQNINYIIVGQSKNITNKCLFITLLCCISLVCSPFLLIAILINIINIRPPVNNNNITHT